MHRIRPLFSFLIAILVLTPGTASAVVHNLVFGPVFSTAAATQGTPTTTAQFSGAGSWYKLYPGAKFEVYFDVAALLGTSFTIDQIASVTYHTVNPATNPSDVDFFLAVYSTPFVGGDASWYGRRVNAEPLYSNGYVAPTAGVWNTWATDVGSNQLTFFDSNHCGNQGFYGAPTLADLQAGPITWSLVPGSGGGAEATPFDYGALTVKYLSFQTGSGWASFEGWLDAITIALTNGDSYVLDLEDATQPTSVDDGWAAGTPGNEIAPGRFMYWNAFPTIQGAVTATPAGGTVNVAAGTYVEQVNVNAKNLTITGSGPGTIVKSPASLATIFTSGDPHKPVMSATQASNVVFEDLEVDGDGNGLGNYRMSGIAYWNAGGRVEDVSIVRIRENPANGNQHGVGVYANNNTGGPYSLECSRLAISDFQKNGFALSGQGLSVDVHDCSVTGLGDVNFIAQNGVQVGFGAYGQVRDCAVSAMRYTPATFVSSGLLVYQAGGPVSLSSLNGANAITNVQAPVNVYDSNASLDGIEVVGGSDYGPIFVGNFSGPAPQTKRAHGRLESRVPAVPFEDAGGLEARDARTLAAYMTTISNSCLTGSDAVGTAGVYAYSTGGAQSVLVQNTNLADWDYGLFADGAAVSLGANTNAITSNVTAGYDNTLGGGAQNAETNWWGAASGPGGVGPGSGDAVLGANVDFAPWLLSGTDTQAGCGFDSGPHNVVTPGPVSGCLSIGNPCVTVPVSIARTTSEHMRGFSIDFTLSGNLTLCGAGVTEGTYLSAIGATNFQVVNNGGGSYTVDCAILGLPCGATAASGLLFEIPVASASPGGVGTVTITSVIARDCDNVSIAASAGAPLGIPIDNVAPAAIAALAAAQVKVGNDGDGTTKVNVSWPAVEAGATVEVYRAGFGNYPEYDDAPGSGSVPATPSYPPGAPWTLAGSVSGVTTLADEVATRDFWYYVAFVKDGCGNVSLVSNQTGGTLNYHLGDVHNTLANCAGDNLVSTSDISFLGANYAITLGVSDPLACLDVGPTTTVNVNGRPTTDNRVQFEDLILFAINYGVVSKAPLAERPLASGVDELGLDAPVAGADGRTWVVPVRMRASGAVQGMSVRLSWNAAAVEPVGVEAGELLRGQSGPAVAWKGDGGDVDVAVFGTGATLTGDGEVARVTFRVIGPGEPDIAIAAVDARGPANERIALGAPRATPATPAARTALGILAPNPFADATQVHFSLRAAGAVRLLVFDLVGRRVRTLHDGPMEAGPRSVRWDGRDDRGLALAPGQYVMQLEAGEVVQSRTVRLVR